MDFCSLGPDPSISCYVTKIKNTTIMLDCGLGLAPRLLESPFKKRRLDGPQLEEPARFRLPQFSLCDAALIDVVLISNYENMLALPYFTEKFGFRGQIFATEPTVQIARQMMLELAYYAGRTSTQNPFQSDAEQGPGQEDQTTLNSQPIYTLNQIKSAIAKVTPVSYKQQIAISDAIEVIPYSSGYCIGTANWVIKTDYWKVSYISKSSIIGLNTIPLEVNCLSNSDICILSDFAAPHTRSIESSLNELTQTIGACLSGGGNALLPMSVGGLFFESLEVIVSYLAGVGLAHIPIYIINPAAEPLLALTNIIGEWLGKKRQEKIYIPQSPYNHTMHIKTGRLTVIPSINDPKFNQTYRSPSIVFCGHHSVRMGDVLHFIRAWKGDARNHIILTDSVPVDLSHVIGAGDPIKVRHIPIERKLKIASNEFKKFLTPLNPKQLIFNSLYQPHMPPRSQHEIVGFKDLLRVSVPLSTTFEKCVLTPRLAASIQPLSLGQKSIAHFQGSLSFHNGSYTVDVNDSPLPSSFEPIWGAPNWERVYQQLSSMESCVVASITPHGNYVMIEAKFGHSVAVLEFHKSKTVIHTKDQAIRMALQQIVLTECDYDVSVNHSSAGLK